MNNTTVEILLVEDNPKDRELTLHALQKHHLANEIEIAVDGQQALDFLFGTPEKARGLPKLVLLDLKLPKVSGHEVLRRIKADPETHDIPVVVLTSSNQEKDIAECYKLGVNSFLQKPVAFAEFVECARTIGLYWLLMNKAPPK